MTSLFSGENEVLIKVYATTVNRTDCGFRSAEYFVSRFFSGLFRPKFKTLGNEFAGEIEETGKAVTSFKAGDKVFGYNDTKFGAHAEYMSMPETGAVATIPDGLTYNEAAPITEGGHYALCDIRSAKFAADKIFSSMVLQEQLDRRQCNWLNTLEPELLPYAMDSKCKSY